MTRESEIDRMDKMSYKGQPIPDPHVSTPTPTTDLLPTSRLTPHEKEKMRTTSFGASRSELA
ncbi:MAG: hypothetical protein DI573_05645 [Microbacterium sp.]|nr:MAG: hypothetical protein DI573_05645 [Microbacterium sp.]